jgi:hypothetical protein
MVTIQKDDSHEGPLYRELVLDDLSNTLNAVNKRKAGNYASMSPLPKREAQINKPMNNVDLT